MKKILVLSLLAAALALGQPPGGDVAFAEISCTGYERRVGMALFGTPGDDRIDCSNSTQDLVIFGLGGDDFILGGRGSDIIDAGPGDDWIFAGAGNNILIGGTGKDALFAGPGRDLLRGGEGNDTLFGGDGDDLLFGGPGDDPLFGAMGMDLCDGQEGDKDWASKTCEITVNVP